VIILLLTRLSLNAEHTACDDRKATFSHIAEDADDVHSTNLPHVK